VIERIYGVEVDPKTGRPKGRRKVEAEGSPDLPPELEPAPSVEQPDLKVTASG
jgi:hypothetical protein